MEIIRGADLGDERSLVLIDHACWSTETDPGEHWHAARPFFGEPTGTRPGEVLVAVDRGTPVGYVKVRAERSEYGDWYIGGLGVAPESRHQGVGRRLITAALAHAEDRAGVTIWLKVLSSNLPAVALYSSLDFREVSRSPGQFRNRPGVDDLRLARPVCTSLDN